jgi:NAD-dependent dihydropyrimidine dehydrogenase PreA subunit
MLRQIIKIDRDKCNGCGREPKARCVQACHEGAIGLKDGKAELLRDDYCDGLGNCLPVCPTGAITFENREAAEYNETEVEKNMEQKNTETLPCGCPGTQARAIKKEEIAHQVEASAQTPAQAVASQLSQWPVQIRLVPVNAPYFENANLLVSADCAAYAYGNFHNEFIRNRITLIGCPKLDPQPRPKVKGSPFDETDYSEKLTAILKSNNIKSVIVARMEVPCCGGIEDAVKTALKNCGKMIPWQVVTISTEGKLVG